MMKSTTQLKFNRIPFLFFVFFAIIQGSAMLANAQAIDTTSMYRITHGLHDGKSLALHYDGTNNRPVLRPTAEQPTQFWKFKKDKYGNYRLVNFRQGNGFSLEVVNDVNKDKLILGATRDLASQAWRISTNPNGTYRITCLWLGTDKALDVLQASAETNELFMNATEKVNPQMWKLIKLPKPMEQGVAPAPVPVIPDFPVTFSVDTTSFYRLSTQWLGEGKSLGVVSGSDQQLQLMEKQEDQSQLWKLRLAPNGYYQLVNMKYPGKCLDIINDSKANNKLTLTSINNYSGQYWKLSPSTDGLFVRLTSLWQGDGKSLDILNDGSNKELIMNASGSYSGQWWKLGKQERLQPSPPIVKSPVVAGFKSKMQAGEKLLPGMELRSPQRHYTFIQQKDGNLVLYNKNKEAIWASDTYGKDVQHCIMQDDGNLVQYLPDHVAAWAPGTDGNAGAYLVVQDDGNVVIYGKDNQALWSTNTVGR